MLDIVGNEVELIQLLEELRSVDPDDTEPRDELIRTIEELLIRDSLLFQMGFIESNDPAWDS